MSLTKIEILHFDLINNQLDVIINGKRKYLKLDKPTINAIKDNIISCVEGRTYIEL